MGTTNWTRRAIVGGGLAVLGAGAAAVGLLASRDGGGLVPGVSRARKVIGDEILPDAVDVVIVGGGIVGCLTALTLAERGVRVAVCEKGVIAGEASGRALGFIDGQFLDPSKMEIVGRSKHLWDTMGQRVEGEMGYRRTGLATLFPDSASIDAAEQWLNAAKGAPGVDGRILTAREAEEIAPGSSDRFAGALFQPSDAAVEPQLAAPAIADAVRKAGGVVLQGCAVRGIETTGGRISGVVTEKGAIACHSVVLAGGAWSPVFARSLGLDLPQFMAFSGIVRRAAVPGPDVCLVSAARGFAARRTIDGHWDACLPIGSAPLTPDILRNLFRLRPAMQNMWDQLRPVINFDTFMAQWRIPKTWALDARSPFEDNRILVPENRIALMDEVVRVTQEAFPALAQAPVIERWSGVLTSTLDNMPVISAVAEKPGLFVGSGFYFGMTMGPAGAEGLADLIMGNAPQIDLAPFRFARFNDGSKLIFRP